MALVKARARVLVQSKPSGEAVVRANPKTVAAEVPPALRPAWALSRVRPKLRKQTIAQLKQKAQEPHFRQERKKMEQAANLSYIADDVEAQATLLEWRAREHGHVPESALWFIALAAGITVAAGVLAFLGNFFGAIAILFVGGLIYVTSQRKPDEVWYRIMVDGIAVNDRLYHYQTLDSFTIVYQPGEVKTVIVRSKKILSPLIHLEIGEADPVKIRGTLLEFLREDLELQEPAADAWARRLGF